jgi:hypothetical protein
MASTKAGECPHAATVSSVRQRVAESAQSSHDRWRSGNGMVALLHRRPNLFRQSCEVFKCRLLDKRNALLFDRHRFVSVLQSGNAFAETNHSGPQYRQRADGLVVLLELP